MKSQHSFIGGHALQAQHLQIMADQPLAGVCLSATCGREPARLLMVVGSWNTGN